MKATNIRIQKFIGALVFLIAVLRLQSKEHPLKIVPIHRETREVEIRKNLEFSEVQNDSFFIEDTQLQWQKSSGPHFGFGYTKKKFAIRNALSYVPDTTQDWVLFVHSPHINTVNFYVFENDRLIKKVKTGSAFPFEQRDMQVRYFACNFLAKKNYMYRFIITTGNQFGSLNVRVRLMNAQAFATFYEQETFVILAFLSVLFVAILVSLFLYFSFRDVIYLLYAAYLGSWFCARAAVFGFLFKYLHPTQPWFVDVSKALFIQLAALFLLQFIPKLLFYNKNLCPAWVRKVFKIQTAIYIVLAAYTLLPYKPEPYSSYLIHFMNFNFIVSIGTICYLSVISFAKGSAPGRLFSLSSVPLLFIALFTIATNFGLLPNSFFTQYPVEIGLGLEFLILAFALSSRYKLLLKEKEYYKQELIHMKSIIATVPTQKPSTFRYKNSRYTKEELSEKYNEIKHFVESQKPYLNPEINMVELAKILQISPHFLSQIINQFEEKNFSEFMNCYRIQHACRLLKDAKYNNYSVEGIGQESGFSTKANFFNIFKKTVGMTPAAYKKEHSKHPERSL